LSIHYCLTAWTRALGRRVESERIGPMLGLVIGPMLGASVHARLPGPVLVNAGRRRRSSWRADARLVIGPMLGASVHAQFGAR